MSVETISKPRYSRGEEFANSITGGVGVILAVAGAAVLIALACRFGDAWHVVSCSVYAATLVFLHLASTLYHSSPVSRTKTFLRVLDHFAIFLLIAGTYTPFTLVSLRGAWGWSLFGVIWALAVIGIVFHGTLRRWPMAEVGLYVGMGWAVVIAIKPLYAALAPAGVLLLAIGGVAYTLGTGFYAWRRLPYHHAIWHLFVLAGSAAHFFAILFYVIPVHFQ